MASCAAWWRSARRSKHAARPIRGAWSSCRNSAHGTNPATAALLGFTVRAVPARDGWNGRAPKPCASKLGPDVAAMMLTNPNTCGLFERDIVEIAAALHEAGAYLYCDGANFNAIAGKVRPGDLGVDAMHINLHKTFSTPHGGGGPGSGPGGAVSEALAPFAPLPLIVQGRRGLPAGRACGSAGRARTLRPAYGLPRPDGHVRARAGLHAEPRRGRRPPGLRGCGVERELRARARCSDVISQPFDGRPCMHEVAVRRPLPEGHRRLHARFRQGADRRGLSSDDGVFPAGGIRRDADRAHGIGIEAKPRSVHRCDPRFGRGRERRRCRPLHRRPALRPAQPRWTRPAPPASRC